MVWLAWPTLRRSHLWSVDMPNVYNFAFDYSLACLVIVAAYLPGEWAHVRFSRLGDGPQCMSMLGDGGGGLGGVLTYAGVSAW